MKDEEVIGEKEGTKEIDWSEMLQMGLALGKSILGEEAVEKLKKGDLSELIKVGEKVLGEDTVKDFLNSATEGAFDTTEDAKEEKNNSDDNDILEDDLEEATEDSPAPPVSEVRSIIINDYYHNSEPCLTLGRYRVSPHRQGS